MAETSHAIFGLHSRTNAGEKPFKCVAMCFAQYSSLKTHVCTRNGEKSINCDLCGCCVARNITLQMHLYTHNVASYIILCFNFASVTEPMDIVRSTNAASFLILLRKVIHVLFFVSFVMSLLSLQHDRHRQDPSCYCQLPRRLQCRKTTVRIEITTSQLVLCTCTLYTSWLPIT